MIRQYWRAFVVLEKFLLFLLILDQNDNILQKLIQVGDSLIQNLFNSRIWETSFCLMHCLNFGISVSSFLLFLQSVRDQRWPFPGGPDWECALASAEWWAGQPLPKGDNFLGRGGEQALPQGDRGLSWSEQPGGFTWRDCRGHQRDLCCH